MMISRKIVLSAMLSACFSTLVHAEAPNMSVRGKYKAVAHSCMSGQCDDQVEHVDAAFFIGDRDAHVYSGANKGLILPFGQRHVSPDGLSVWIVPTATGFDESYARDGFTITHHFMVHQNGTCSVTVSVAKAPAAVNTTYSVDMESCSVAGGNIFAQR